MSPDNLVASVAGTQDGVVSRGQVLLLGLTDEWIEARLRSGRWQRVFAGTYATFSGPVPFAARVSAALLRAGPGATARGRTAAALYGLVPPDLARPIEVLVPRSRRVTAEPVIRVRYSQEVDVRRNPLWSPSRVWVEDAVLDLAQECRSLTDVAGWVSRASARSLTTPERVRAALRDRARHRWRRELMAMLADIEVGAHSPLEIRYLNRVERAHGLPRGARQHPVVGRTVRFVDVEYEEFTTRVELDGRVGHEGDGAFRDRRRDNAGVRSGRATLRYGWGEIFDAACEVAGEVAGVLRSRGWSGRPRGCGPRCHLAGAAARTSGPDSREGSSVS